VAAPRLQRDAVESSQRLIGAVEQRLHGGVDPQRWIGWQRPGVEGPVAVWAALGQAKLAGSQAGRGGLGGNLGSIVYYASSLLNDTVETFR
jgi:hypothetical protein